MLKRLIRLLSSLTLAYWLMFALLVFLIMGSFFPHPAFQDIYSPVWQKANPVLWKIMQLLSFEYIFQSWLFYSLIGLFLLNTFFCTVGQVKKARAVSSHEIRSSTFVLIEGEQAHKRLNAMGFHLRQQDGQSFIATKGWLSLWGMVIFHGSFLLIVIGVLMGQLFAFQGRLLLTEGQWLEDQGDSYLYVSKSPFVEDPHSHFKIGLDKVQTQQKGDITLTKNYLSFVNVEGKETKGVSESGMYFRYNNYGVFTDESGFSPKIVVSAADGTLTYANGFIPLLKQGELYRETLVINGRQLRLNFDGEVLSAFLVGEREGVKLKQGETAQLNEFKLTFSDLRRWTSFIVEKDSGIPIVFYSSWLGIVGAILFFYRPYTRVWLRREDNGIKLGVQSNRKSRQVEADIIARLMSEGDVGQW